MAEGLSLEASARLFELEPETLAQWLALAANHSEALSAYLSQNLELEQVQLDDLYVKLRLVQSSDRTGVRWLGQAEFAYVQVVKRRLRRRLVGVKHRLVRGQLKPIKAKLAEHGWSINTAHKERFNLTLRQHGPAWPVPACLGADNRAKAPQKPDPRA